MNIDVLRNIANTNAASQPFYVGQADGQPLVQAGYITVDGSAVNPADANQRGATITQAGANYLANLNGNPNVGKPVGTGFTIMSGIELPKVARGFKKGQGGGGAPSKYNFDDMQIGDFFFVANTAVTKGDAVKTLGSAAGSANQRFAVGTGEFETVKRAKRGTDHKAIKDQNGKNIMEDVSVEKKNFTRKFVVRPVKAGVKYGPWEAPADGAVVARVEPK